jgi:GTP-binding protein
MNLRNVAIIAHVDHGKTTLVDRLLQQSGTYRDNQRVVERAMDSNDLERERGITILAKAASVQWKDIRINIVDTPGHADFGGEVERILNMVDGALVLVDAAEGPLPQTKFVVSKALKVGLKPIVVINKVDRPDARPTEVINEVFDLFAALDASEEQLDFPILYGSAKQGWMADSPDGPQDAGMQPLFDLIVRHVAPPTVEEGPFRMIGTILEANPYLGRIITGRITSGSIKPNQAVKVLGADGKQIESGRITKILAFRGIERTPLDEAHAGDIVADGVDVVHRQQLAARRHRRRQGDLAHDPRPPAARSRRQCRAARDRGLRQGCDGSVRPRRIAARDPDRDHAPRRF